MDTELRAEVLQLLLADLDLYIREQRILVWPELALCDEILAESPQAAYFDFSKGRVA